MITILLFFLISILLLLAYIRTNHSLNSRDRKIYLISILLTSFGIFFSYLFLLSKKNLFQSDMIAYFYNLVSIRSMAGMSSIIEIVQAESFEKGFTVLQIFIGYFVNNAQTYALLIYSLNLFLILVAAVIFQGVETVPFVMVQYMFFNVFNTGSLIVLRQGIAISILLIAIVTYIRGWKITSIFLMLLAAQFHSTAYIMVITFLIIEIFRLNEKFLAVLWLGASVLYISGFNQILIEHIPFGSRYLDSYTSTLWLGESSNYGQTPNSLKYLIYSALFLFILLFLKNVFLKNDLSATIMIRVYIIWNIVFLMFGYIAFSSRIALYSWMIFPLAMIYIFWASKRLTSYYYLFLIGWLVLGLRSLPIWG